MERSQNEVKHVFILETNPRHIEDSIIPFSSLASLHKHVNSIIQKHLRKVFVLERTAIVEAMVVGDTNLATKLFNDATPHNEHEPINLHLKWSDHPLVVL